MDTTEEQAATEGQEAFEAGKELGDNPYLLDPNDFENSYPCFASWSCAWIKAHKSKYQRDKPEDTE